MKNFILLEIYYGPHRVDSCQGRKQPLPLRKNVLVNIELVEKITNGWVILESKPYKLNGEWISSQRFKYPCYLFDCYRVTPECAEQLFAKKLLDMLGEVKVNAYDNARLIRQHGATKNIFEREVVDNIERVYSTRIDCKPVPELSPAIQGGTDGRY